MTVMWGTGLWLSFYWWVDRISDSPAPWQPCHAQASLPLFTPVCRVLLGTPSPVSVLPSRCLHTCAPVPSLPSALSPSVLKGSGPGHFPMSSKAHHCLSLAALAVVMEMRGPGGCSPILSFQPWLLCLCVCGPALFAETPLPSYHMS